MDSFYVSISWHDSIFSASYSLPKIHVVLKCEMVELKVGPDYLSDISTFNLL